MKNIKRLAALMLLFSTMSMVGCGTNNNSSKPNTSDNSIAKETVDLTLNYNYDGATDQVVKVEKGTKPTKPSEPTRDGYTFTGWYLEADAINNYSFEEVLNNDMTIYAGWLDSTKTYYDVTFDLNYDGAPTPTVLKVEAESYVTLPSNPTRDGFEFVNWCTDKEGTQKFKIITPVTSNMTLYASWTKQFTFEAEYISTIEDMSGAGYSGTATGLEMIKGDDGTAKASNNHWVTFLYAKGITLEYVINSDRDVSDAKMALRLSAEVMDITIDTQSYNILVNDKLIAYPEISITDVPSQGSGKTKEFQDFTITKALSLKQGENHIKLVTNNNNAMFGTMSATAPMVDCMKITTDADLTWNPALDNVTD